MYSTTFFRGHSTKFKYLVLYGCGKLSIGALLTLSERVHVPDGLCGQFLERLSTETTPLSLVAASKGQRSRYCGIGDNQPINTTLHVYKKLSFQLYNQVCTDLLSCYHDGNVSFVLLTEVRCNLNEQGQWVRETVPLCKHLHVI